ncbi:MAG: thiamine phosphate synthase [Luteimonas sp.]
MNPAGPRSVGPIAPTEDTEWLEGIERALAAGVRRLHLRLPEQRPGADIAAAGAARPPYPDVLPARRESLIRQAVALAHAAGAEALVGGDIELARATGAGVHLRAAQLSALHKRPLPAVFPVAASCHDEAELRHAQRLGCDFAVLGPVQPTPTHPEAAGLGWTRFATLRETVSLPIYAIGGLSPTDISTARRHGAQGIAAIRALWPPTLLPDL